METSDKRPRVGIGVMILKGNSILLGKRKGSVAADEYAFPGGSLEYMESFEDCARRETLEECGLEIAEVRIQFVANLCGYAPNHYVDIGLIALWKGGEPVVMEPEKCERWDWYDLESLPERLFDGTRLAIHSFRTGFSHYDVQDVAKILA